MEALLALAGGAAAGALFTEFRRRVAARRRSSAFATGAVERLVSPGLVGPTSARIWLRTDRPGAHTLTMTTPEAVATTARFEVVDDGVSDLTHVVRWPSDVGADPLRPGTRYTFEVRHVDDGSLVGDGRFVTAPLGPDDARDEISFAIASCHQPFTDAGELRPESLGLLATLETAFEALGVEQLLLLGDQMYTDLPQHHSLFRRRFRHPGAPGRRRVLDCSREEIRRLLHHRYRTFWQVEAFRRLQANYATLCMLDDHEIVDNFGSDPTHSSAEWANFREGAIDAFHDYQALRSHDREPRPPTFATRFARGPVAGLVLDLRTERVSDAERIRILDEDQWALLDRFLAEEALRPVLLLGLSVPIVHAPDWLVNSAGRIAPQGSGIHDRWSHPHARPDLDRLLHRLRRHREAWPTQRVVLLGGDIHVGVVSALQLGDAPPMIQFVSSAVSNLEKRINRAASAALPVATGETTTEDGLCCNVTLVPGLEGHDENPTAALNAGVLTVRRDAATWRIRLRILGQVPGDPPTARVVFDSGEL